MNKIAKIFLVAVALCVLTTIIVAQQNKAEQLYQQALYEMEGKGDYSKAIESFNLVMTKFPKEKVTAAKALLNIGRCYEKLGKSEALKAYERIIREFKDQKQIVAEARARLAVLKQPEEISGPTTRRILVDANKIGDVLTADGKYIGSLDRNTGDILQFEISSGDTTRITNRGPAHETGDVYELPAYSRNGKQIAYCSYTKENDWGPQLRIRNLDGSGLRTLYSEKGVANIMPVDWSPDAGSILALCSRDKTAAVRAMELTLISTADGSVRVLKSIQSSLFWFQRASFSPDGRSVAFSFVREGSPPHGDVFLMTADGRNEVVVAGHPAEDRLLRWTPDGRSLVFLSDRSGTWDIWTVHITDGKQQGEPELLKKDFGYDSEVLGSAPDGSLYYKTVTSLGGLYNGAVDLETGKVLVPPAPVATRYTGPPLQPTWSPDGKNLAYISHRGSILLGNGNNILTIRSTATGEERLLSLRLRFVNQISWAPDGRSVIALGITEKETGIFRIDAETGEITRLADLGLLPHLCPDGKTLVFLGEGVIRKRNLDTGEESEVVKTGRVLYDLSPDGREVVFQVDGAVKIVSLNGGEPRELFRGLAQYYRLRWTRDGRYIIAQALSMAFGTASGEIWRVPAQGGTPLKLDLSVPKMDSFALHPDNRRFAYSVNEGSKSELWVMENFLPKEIPEDKAFKIKKVSDFGTEGSVSPDGKYLSYVDWESGNGGELAIYEIATGKKSRLTNSGPDSEGFPLYSRWSPDSKQLVYDWYDENGHVDLCVVGLDGSKPRTLYNNKEVLWAQTFGWSPDGKQILAIFYRKTNYQIVLVSTADGSVRDLKTVESGQPDLNMFFSPDSRYIVYDFQQKENSPERDISILSIDGANEISLVKHPANDYVLGWAPDGKNILFASDRGNNLGAWVIQFSDGKVQGTPKLVKANIGQVYPMGFTQKGSFYYGINDNMREIFLAELNPETGKIIAPINKLSTHFEGSLTQPTYSPDGKYITYTLHIMFSDVLCIHSLENDQEKYFYPKLKRIQQPHWSPDGHSIFFGGWDLIGKKGIYSMDVQSGIFSLIVPPAKESSEMFIAGIELSPNGKEIFLTRISNNLTQIMSRDLVSGIEKEIYREAHRTSIDFSCSPDGKWLAIMQVVEERVLKIIPVAGGEPKELYKFKKNDNPAFFKWTPDGKHIIFNNLDSEGKKFSLWRISVEGGEVQKVGLESNNRINASIHPDGKHIVFSSPVSTGENSGNWVMENFFAE